MNLLSACFHLWKSSARGTFDRGQRELIIQFIIISMVVHNVSFDDAFTHIMVLIQMSSVANCIRFGEKPSSYNSLAKSVAKRCSFPIQTHTTDGACFLLFVEHECFSVLFLNIICSSR